MEENLQSKNVEEGTNTRRGFLKIAIAVLAALAGLVSGAPFIKALLSPTLRRKSDWSKVAETASLPEGRPVEMKFRMMTEDAYHNRNVVYSVWVIKHPGDKLTVFSPICTHLGCHFLWNPKIEKFACPCHASMFAPDGAVLYGPAPRPLDTLEHKIEDGALFVKWERFRVGTPQKISI